MKRWVLLTLILLVSPALSCLDEATNMEPEPLDCMMLQTRGAGLESFADAINGKLSVRFRFVDLSLARWERVEVVGVVGGALEQVIIPTQINQDVLVFIALDTPEPASGSFNFEALIQDPLSAESCGVRGELAFLMYGDGVRMSLRSVGPFVDSPQN